MCAYFSLIMKGTHRQLLCPPRPILSLQVEPTRVTLKSTPITVNAAASSVVYVLDFPLPYPVLVRVHAQLVIISFVGRQLGIRPVLSIHALQYEILLQCVPAQSTL